MKVVTDILDMEGEAYDHSVSLVVDLSDSTLFPQKNAPYSLP